MFVVQKPGLASNLNAIGQGMGKEDAVYLYDGILHRMRASELHPRAAVWMIAFKCKNGQCGSVILASKIAITLGKGY